MDPSLNLPPEVWTKIFLFACTVPDAFSAHPKGTRNVLQSEAREDWWRLQNEVASCRYTYRCIALVCRSWYHFSLPFFWNHLVLSSPTTVAGAAAALVASRSYSLQHPHYKNQSHGLSPDGTYSSNARSNPTGGMGWFVRRIDLDINIQQPTMALNEQLLSGLAQILRLCPNLHIFADHAHPGPSFDERYVLYLPDGLLSYVFHSQNVLRRVDWSANNLIPFASFLPYAPNLEVLSLHYFTGPPITWLGINRSVGISLPNLQTLVLNEDPACSQAALVSTWDMPRLHMLRLEVSPDFGSDQFLRIHGHKLTTLSIHTPATPRPLLPTGHYCAYTPHLEALYFQLHHPAFTLNTPLPQLRIIGIHGLLNFRGRSFDDGEEELLHQHLTGMVRCRIRMPALKVIRLVDFDPESWNSQDRTAREVARWQRWQLRWEMLGVRWEDRDGQLMRVPNALLELLEQRDLDDEEIYSDDEMAVDEEIEGFSDYLSMSSASGMWD
ncbi:SubName: Full=Uncharacterized protein {ECO:0000313/EMBL:CCA70501.1} [Serendipita indica DSM 11827]|uniref:Uncharacterized protein n=1 Tax=Serendipita indica (strain DSM 11827) TaxID=1109443 RepID=G4TGQ8_SERID|nr:SubName: Full=Uncharacterized protein {ECO:0000313/EMBL:CCA70501.1} [Serendipita indica DSM 11827]CCA70501.1 hypothetical protein PIIN_04438 [Serendipita indica DSM 11827]